MSAEIVRREADQSVTAAPSIIDIINKLASSPALSKDAVDAVRELVAMQEKREAKDQRDRFFDALAACQKEMPRVQKNGLIDPKGAAIPYAKLEDLDACIRPIYERYGFSVFYNSPMTVDGGKIRVSANFSAFGHTEPTEITAAPDGGDAGRLKTSPIQAVKKTITAGRRHLLEMFFNIITVDADTDGMMPATAITAAHAKEITDRMNGLLQKEPGSLLAKLCKLYSVDRIEDLKIADFGKAIKDVEASERRDAERRSAKT